MHMHTPHRRHQRQHSKFSSDEQRDCCSVKAAAICAHYEDQCSPRSITEEPLAPLSIHPNSNRDFSPFFWGSIHSSQQPPAGYTQKPQAAVHKSQASPAPQNDERPFLPLYFLLVFLYLTRLENSLVYTKTSLVSRVRVACLRVACCLYT